jgi:hypothetical protein
LAEPAGANDRDGFGKIRHSEDAGRGGVEWWEQRVAVGRALMRRPTAPPSPLLA